MTKVTCVRDESVLNFSTTLQQRIADHVIDQPFPPPFTDAEIEPWVVDSESYQIEYENILAARTRRVARGQFGINWDILSNVKLGARQPSRWNGRLPIGCVTMMIGDGGIGKSLLTVELAARVTRGETMPDEDLPLPPLPVAVVSFEDSIEGVWKHRFRQAGGDENKLIVMRTDAGFQMGDLGDLSGHFGLVIIDPLLSLCNITGTNVRNPDKARILMDQLKALAERLDTPVLMVHHLNRSHTMLGAAQWSQSARSVLLVCEQKTGNLGVSHDKFNHTAKQPTLEFEKVVSPGGVAFTQFIGVNEDLEFYIKPRPKAGADDGSSKYQERIQWVVDTLMEHRGWMKRSLLDKLFVAESGKSPKTLQRVLDEAMKQNLLVKMDHGQTIALVAISDFDDLLDNVVQLRP